jgi:hypothetical protein
VHVICGQARSNNIRPEACIIPEYARRSGVDLLAAREGALMGFELDFWDYVTFASLAVTGALFIWVLVVIAGVPGQIAIARKHPDAEAVKIMGYAGFLAMVPWIQAFIWAFKPTNIVDIRRFPEAEARAIDEDIARLKADDSKPAKKLAKEAENAPAQDNDTKG